MTDQKTSWMTIKPEEVKEKIIELAKQGLPPEKIGLMLRDQHGIPRAKLLGVKIKKTLIEAKLWNNPETVNIANKTEFLNKHVLVHKHDYKGKRTLVRRNAQLNILRRIQK